MFAPPIYGLFWRFRGSLFQICRCFGRLGTHLFDLSRQLSKPLRATHWTNLKYSSWQGKGTFANELKMPDWEDSSQSQCECFGSIEPSIEQKCSSYWVVVPSSDSQFYINPSDCCLAGWCNVFPNRYINIRCGRNLFYLSGLRVSLFRIGWGGDIFDGR